MATNPGRLQSRPPDVVDHGAGRVGLWLQQRRIQIALWIAVIEGLLVAVHVINRWVAIARRDRGDHGLLLRRTGVEVADGAAGELGRPPRPRRPSS